jgi:hypothetical protein
LLWLSRIRIALLKSIFLFSGLASHPIPILFSQSLTQPSSNHHHLAVLPTHQSLFLSALRVASPHSLHSLVISCFCFSSHLTLPTCNILTICRSFHHRPVIAGLKQKKLWPWTSPTYRIDSRQSLSIFSTDTHSVILVHTYRLINSYSFQSLPGLDTATSRCTPTEQPADIFCPVRPRPDRGSACQHPTKASSDTGSHTRCWPSAYSTRLINSIHDILLVGCLLRRRVPHRLTSSISELGVCLQLLPETPIIWDE